MRPNLVQENPVDPTKRFSNRVDNYIKYRPGYPPGIIEFFREALGVAPGSIVADVGSGTGKLSEMLLEAGYQVTGVEPNDAMRAAAEYLLARFPSFRSVAAKAEETTLDDASVDLIVAGQAFHWFDQAAAKKEFERILKPGGHVALIWNDREPDGGPMLRAYEAFLREYCPEYATATHTDVAAESLEAFFGAGRVAEVRFENSQTLDYEGLKGRLLSCSYVPVEGPDFERLMEALPRLFDSHEKNGRVTLVYETKVFYGTAKASRGLGE